jgi:hypothetical protein
MPTMHMRGFALRESATAPEPGEPIPFVLATEGRKADGLDLAMSNVDLERYVSNPVLMWAHEYWGRENGLPLGRVDDVRVDGDRLRGNLVFDQDDDFARRVEGKYRNRFLNAVSVGFDARDIDDAGVPGRWELYEVSAVPLPMDPNAVADDGRGALALARAFGALGALPDLGRAGKVLSKKNHGLVESAHTALGALLEAARKDDAADDTDEDEGRSATPALEDAQRRLRLAAH